MVEPPFRMITNRLLLENIKSLIIKETDVSIIDPTHLEILNKIYYSFLTNIKLTIINKKYIKETGYEHFENEWKPIKTCTSLKSIANISVYRLSTTKAYCTAHPLLSCWRMNYL